MQTEGKININNKKTSYKDKIKIVTGLPYGKPSRKIRRFPFFFFFSVFFPCR